MLLIKILVVELIKTNRVRTRRNRGQITQLLEEFEKANIPAAEFCRQHQINIANFHKWRSRYKPDANSNATAPGFASVKVVDVSSSPSLFAEVNGIRIFQPVSAAFLKALVR